MYNQKEYERIQFSAGNTIEEVVNKLLKHKNKGKLVCGDFNGTTLYSDTVTLDGAYKAITGKTKAEKDQELKQWKEKRKKERNEFEERKMPNLVKTYMEKGRKVLSKDKWEHWDKILPIRLRDLYQGVELDCCLDIAEILNNNGTFKEAKQEIDSQGHSGMSFSLTCSLSREFCDNGQEFVDYVYK